MQQCKSKGGIRAVNNSQNTKNDSFTKIKNKYSPTKNKETPLKKLNVKLESRILKASLFINNDDDKNDSLLKHYINFISTSSLQENSKLVNKFIVNNIKIIEDFLKLDIKNKVNKLSSNNVIITKPRNETKPIIKLSSPFDEMPNLPPKSRKSATLCSEMLPPSSSFKKRSSIQDIINQHKKSNQVSDKVIKANTTNTTNT